MADITLRSKLKRNSVKNTGTANCGKALARSADAVARERELEKIFSNSIYLDDFASEIEEIDITGYRTISKRKIYGRQYFNKEWRTWWWQYTVVGMKLVFDRDFGDETISALGDPDRPHTNIKRINIIADSVQITTPLHFPQTDVWIHARELILDGEGSIDTSPLYKTYAPDSPPIENANRDSTGAAGDHGPNAGSIVLHVKSLSIPKSDKPIYRFITKGANGQPGGIGGYIGQKPKPEDEPDPVTWESLKKVVFGNKHHNWKYFCLPVSISDIGGGSRFTQNQKSVVFKYKNNQVFYAKITVKAGSNWVNPEWKYELGKPGNVPTSGRDAYPSGKGGNSGNGGNIHIIHEGKTYCEKEESGFIRTKKDLKALADPSRGQAGKSPKMDREPPLRRAKAYHADVVFLEPDNSSYAYEPSSDFVEVTAKWGAGAKENNGGPGSSGTVEIKPNYSGGWVHEYNAEVALRYAKEAYLKHQREPALDIVRTYREALNSAVNRYLEIGKKEGGHLLTKLPDFKSRLENLKSIKSRMEALENQIRRDLDIFGNQMGWVPYLSTCTSLDLYNRQSAHAFNMMYHCYIMKKQWEGMKDRRENLTAIRDTVGEQIKQTEEALRESQTEIPKIRKELQKVDSEIENIVNKIKGIEADIKVDAEITEKQRAILSGATKLLTAATQLFPYGQPYLGAAGNIAGSIALGIIEEKDGFDVAKQITEDTFKTIGENKELITDHLSKGIKISLKKKIAENSKKMKKVSDDAGEIGVLRQECQDEITAIEQDIDEQINMLESLGQPFESLAKLSKEKDSKQSWEDWFKSRTEAMKGCTNSYKKKLTELENRKDNEKIPLFDRITDKIHEKRIKPLKDKIKTAPRAEKKKLEKKLAEIEKNAMPEYIQEEKKKIKQHLEKMEKLETKQAKLNKEVVKYDKVKEKQANSAEKITAALAGSQEGVLQTIDAVRTLSMPKEEMDAKIQARYEKIRTSETQYTARFEELQDELEELNLTKENVVRQLDQCLANINHGATEISCDLKKQEDIGDQMAGLAEAMDHSVISTIDGWDQEARETLMKQRYYFAKSYEYHKLKKVPYKFYDVQPFIDEFKNFMEAGNKTLKEEHFTTLRDLLDADLKTMATQIVDDLQKGMKQKKPKLSASASELVDYEEFQKLNKPYRQGYYHPLRINLYAGGMGAITNQRFRIVDLNLKRVSVVDIEKYKDKGLSFTMRFIHSGNSIVYDGNRYYMFRAQTPDERRSWDFTCEIDKPGDTNLVIRPDQLPVSDDEEQGEQIELLNHLFDNDSKKSYILAKPYSPGAFSDITVYRKKQVGPTAKISDFAIEVKYETYRSKQV